ncbi:MAG: ABC transporter permease [Bacilli bacterium]|nr:ABC transporter permease [Bacilli bacterium]
MLSKLAFNNIKKSIKDYSIYFFTLVMATTIFYIFNSIDSQTSMLSLTESKSAIINSISTIIGYVSVFVSIILGFLIVYSNNFLIKRRKKEFGLYLTLGMSKRKVSFILVIETILVGLISLAVGLLLGIILSQFLSILTAKLFVVDMTSFKFIFSKAALLKTISYFSYIYLLVMIFNVITLSRYKIIDLLNANKKSEKMHFKNKFVIIISFILSIVLIKYAYYLLDSGILFTMDKRVIYMLISGALGTLLLFFSVSGFFLKVLQMFKNFYYKNLNIFVLKQVNSKVNTTVISNTIICLMLLLTIGILSGSISLANVFNSNITKTNKTDFTIISYSNVYEIDENGEYIPKSLENTLPDLINEDFFKETVKDYTTITYYQTEELLYKKIIDSKTLEKLVDQYGKEMMDSFTQSKIFIISLSDYNKAMKLFGKDELNLEKNQYAIASDMDTMRDWYKTNYQSENTMNINGNILSPLKGKIIDMSLENSVGFSNQGFIIVNDEVITSMDSNYSIIIGNYTNPLNEQEEQDFISEIGKPGLNLYTQTKTDMETSSIGVKAILVFIGLYLGIIFAISSATILAISQLSEASDNKNRYRILKQIGADNKMIKKSLLTQIAIAFMLPLSVAIFHAYFGLKELNGVIKLLGNIDLSNNLILTTLFIVVIYGGYFLATYIVSKRIIKD